MDSDAVWKPCVLNHTVTLSDLSVAPTMNSFVTSGVFSMV